MTTTADINQMKARIRFWVLKGPKTLGSDRKGENEVYQWLHVNDFMKIVQQCLPIYSIGTGSTEVPQGQQGYDTAQAQEL